MPQEAANQNMTRSRAKELETKEFIVESAPNYGNHGHEERIIRGFARLYQRPLKICEPTRKHFIDSLGLK